VQTQLAVPILKLFHAPSPKPPTYCSQHAAARLRSVTCTPPAGVPGSSRIIVAHSQLESVRAPPKALPACVTSAQAISAPRTQHRALLRQLHNNHARLSYLDPARTSFLRHHPAITTLRHYDSHERIHRGPAVHAGVHCDDNRQHHHAAMGVLSSCRLSLIQRCLTLLMCAPEWRARILLRPPLPLLCENWALRSLPSHHRLRQRCLLLQHVAHRWVSDELRRGR
jgi:hypothetical protein